MTHRTDVEKYPGPLAELAGDLASLRYDALAELLAALARQLDADADADAARGRPRLAAELRAAAGGVASAAAAIGRAWDICGPRT